MRALLLQLDGKVPNIALMRISAHYRKQGYEIEFRRTGNLSRMLFDEGYYDAVFASLIFEKSRPLAVEVLRAYPQAVIGGAGTSLDQVRLESHLGIYSLDQDYSIYPRFQDSIGYTQRGCRFKCGFCRVPKMEPEFQSVASVYDIWRGDRWPRNLLLLDNDFFGQKEWRERIREIREGNFKVSFNQGINARMLTDETAEAVASVRYYDDQFKTRRIYTAWDNQRDEARLFRGLSSLVKYGVKPDHIMVYMLIGYWPGETASDREYRRAKLRDFGCRPYPMPFVRTPELVGFQRFVIGAYDKRVSWERFVSARYQPANLGYPSSQLELYSLE